MEIQFLNEEIKAFDQIITHHQKKLKVWTELRSKYLKKLLEIQLRTFNKD